MQRSLFGWLTFTLLVLAGGTSPAAREPASPAASPADAAKQLDLATFPLLDGADAASVRQTTALAYDVKAGLKAAYGQIRKQLTERGWKEEPQASVTDDYASGVFSRNGYVTSLTIMPASDSGLAAIRLQQHGNVDLARLPAGPDAKVVYGGPTSLILGTPATAEKAAAWIDGALTKAGWEPYGSGGPTRMYRQRGVILTTLISDAVPPATGAVIQYSTRMVAQEIPAPPDAEQIQFADDLNQLAFDARADAAAIADFYRERLAAAEWKPTTERWVEDGFSRSLIFRHAAGDLLLLEHREVDGRSRVVVRHQSAAEVKAEGERFRAAQALAMKEKASAPRLRRVAILVPNGAQGDADGGGSVRWTVPQGSAVTHAKAIRQALQDDGWKETSGALEPLAGMVVLDKDDASITIDYTDTGFLPAELNVRASRCELELKAGGGAEAPPASDR
jgi:hypothetical protein